jgi:hypothetical protein
VAQMALEAAGFHRPEWSHAGLLPCSAIYEADA